MAFLAAPVSELIAMPTAKVTALRGEIKPSHAGPSFPIRELVGDHYLAAGWDPPVHVDADPHRFKGLRVRFVSFSC